jgi:hypothetical protein
MSSEILNNYDRLSSGNKELLDRVAAELAEREGMLRQQQAKQIVDMIQGAAQPVIAQPEIIAAPVAPIPDVFYVTGSQDEINLSHLSQADRADYVRALSAQTQEMHTEPEIAAAPAYASFPPGFSSAPQPLTAERGRKFTRPTRKQAVYAGSAALALSLVGGGVVTNGYGTGITIPGLTQEQAEAQSNLADAAPTAEPTAKETAPAATPELKLSAADIVLGDCLDDNGQGKSLTSATVNLGANQNYKLKTLTGEEVLLVNGTEKPRVEIPEAKVNVAACIPSEARKDAIVVDGNKVKINWDKIDRQLGVTPGAKNPTVEVWDMDAEPGVTDRATVAALVAAMGDPANQNAAINIARAEFGKKVIGENEPAVQAKLTDAMKADVTAQVAALQAAKKAPAGEVTVEFTGTPKPLGYKGPAAEKPTAFEVVDVAMKDNDNDPKTPPVVEFK